MNLYLLTDHLLNFMAPAAFVALVLVVSTSLKGRLFKRKRPPARGIAGQVAIVFIVNLVMLSAGLAVFGSDAKMASYGAMALVAGFCQWMLLRGWQR
ncbi:MAG: hypothetical protein JWP47_1278 [Polaromonas sp.]|jgi:hypothetical protein|nr:hypothetical protein [Polaromonas sp.]